MVSADSLNLDVLELIFSYLSSKDLSAVTLVSKSFLAGAIPRLYRTLSFRLRHAKKYPRVSTSFSVILSHPELAIHVQTIDIRITPLLDGKAHPLFVRECNRTIELCKNLRSFVYTPDTVSAILPALQGKNRLEDLRLNARLTTDQAQILIKLKNIQRITLEFGSWNVIDLLPRWSESVQRTLTTLTLYMSAEVNGEVLDLTLRQLPQLTGFHVVGCPKVDHVLVLKLTRHTPLLESLAFTVTESMQPDLPPSPLYQLRDLALDYHSGTMVEPPSSPTILAILNHLKSSLSPLSSISLRIPDLKTAACRPLIKQLLNNHAHTLKKIFLLNSNIGNESVAAICTKCIHLEQLSIPLPIKDIIAFTSAISHSATLRTVIDADIHTAHGMRPSLNHGNIRYMMRTVRNLTKVISERRIWTGQRDAAGNVHISFERQSMSGPSAHWFMPHN